MSVRNLHQAGEDEDVTTVEVVRSMTHFRIDGEVIGVITECLRPRVVAQELDTVREPLLQFGLQSVVVVRGIVAEVIDTLRPAIEWKEFLPLVVAQSSKTDDRRLVDVISGTVPGEAVCALVTDVRDLTGHGLGDLVLDRQVPGIDCWELHLLVQSTLEDLVGQRDLSIRVRSREHRSWRTVLQQEGVREVAAGWSGHLLRCQYRQVLRHAMTKHGAEDADIEAATVAGANDRAVGQ